MSKINKQEAENDRVPDPDCAERSWDVAESNAALFTFFFR